MAEAEIHYLLSTLYNECALGLLAVISDSPRGNHKKWDLPNNVNLN